jgi:hypothetical protein
MGVANRVQQYDLDSHLVIRPESLRPKRVSRPNAARYRPNVRRSIMRGILLFSFTFTLIFAAHPVLCQTDQPNEIRCASGTACAAGAVPKFATAGGSATVNNSIIRQASGNININGNVGIRTSIPTERLDLGNGGNIVIKTDPGNDTTAGNVGYKLLGRGVNGVPNTWAIYTAPVGGGFGVPANSLSIWQYPPNASPGCCLERFTILPAKAATSPSTVTIDDFGGVIAGYLRSNTTVIVGTCLYVAGISFAGNCGSDARLKENIKPFPAVLDKIARLQPVSYTWRAETLPEELRRSPFRSSRAAGLIAQDVEKVFPEMVSVDKRGFKTVNYSELPYLMLQAIRDLKAENDDLRQRLKDENERLQRLENAATH